jgi:hypothetical protein
MAAMGDDKLSLLFSFVDPGYQFRIDHVFPRTSTSRSARRRQEAPAARGAWGFTCSDISAVSVTSAFFPGKDFAEVEH